MKPRSMAGIADRGQQRVSTRRPVVDTSRADVSTLERARRVLDTSSDDLAKKEAARTKVFSERVARSTKWPGGTSASRSGAMARHGKSIWTTAGCAVFTTRAGAHKSLLEWSRNWTRRTEMFSPRFVSQLAVLDLATRSRMRPLERPAYDAKIHVYARRRLQTFAYAAKSFSTPLSIYSLTPAFHDFPGDVEAAFAMLDRVTQPTLLERERNWTNGDELFLTCSV